MWTKILISIMGSAFGLLSSAGVFTVLISVGLIPRFIRTTGTTRALMFYEEMVILGTILGGVYSLFFPAVRPTHIIISTVILSFYGFFSGCFVGCLALAVAEMLNAIPIFARRIQFHEHLRPVIYAVALGKLFGSLAYFYFDMGKLFP